MRAVVFHTTLRAFLVCLLCASPGACSLAMRAVPVDASPAMWETLAGDWRGDYTMTGHDRRGLIAFRLTAGEQQAFGDVLMIPEHHAWPYAARPGRELPASRPPDTESQLLTIRFVSAERGLVRGTLDPYWDPDRSCQARASFLGSVDGGVIAGSFTTVCEDGRRALSGRWRVERK